MGEAAHPGPYRRLRRQVDARMPSSGLSTQATVVDESDDEMPLLREACQGNEGNTRAVPHRSGSRRLVLVGGGSQSQNRYSPLAHEDENQVDHNQDAIVSSKRSRQLELQVTVPVEHSQPTCPVVDMTQEDSVSEARSDSSLSGVLDALEADLDRPEASESDTESLRLPPRRRLVIRAPHNCSNLMNRLIPEAQCCLSQGKSA